MSGVTNVLGGILGTKGEDVKEKATEYVVEKAK